ncbi:MAG TPA: efflux RND transporter permease subunit, partial [Candidatus Wallbacteria bacterium]|nr:efflux RND transporter permease subunit [Candidatus Wallbacteria bacterium]
MFNNALLYSALALVISSVYVIIQNFLVNFFQSIFKSSSDIYGAISALIVAFLFEPLNRKLNDFITGIIDFFKDINRPIASEAQTPQQRSHFGAGDLKALEVAYIVFAFCFITIFVAAKLLPGIAPKVSYMISAMSLSLSALYILYKILHLPFNMTAYTAISVFFIFVHILFVSLTGGAGFYIEVSGALVSLICLVSAAGLIGRIIAVRIDEIGFLIPLCLIAALADIWSVFFGVTSELVSKKSAALNYLLMRYPTLSAGDLRQYIGISDFLFATILMGAAMNFKLNVKKTYAGFAAAFFITFLTVVITHRGIPAIPAISLAFIIINGPRLKIKLEDIKTMFIVIGGVLAVLKTPLDALPDLSDVQVIVYTEYPGQAPQVVEDQVTYPLTTAMLAVPKSKVVRGF